jgi:hypothetical protein
MNKTLLICTTTLFIFNAVFLVVTSLASCAPTMSGTDATAITAELKEINKTLTAIEANLSTMKG